MNRFQHTFIPQAGSIARAALPLFLCINASNADYICTNCPPTNCVCASTLPPGGWLPDEVPQIILLTFDDSVNSNVYHRVQQVLTNHYNPNGDPMQATFFVSLDGIVDYWYIQRLHAEGHEVAVHTMTHSTSTNTSLETFRAEIAGCRKTLSRLAQIPEEEIIGFRAPYLYYNDNSFQILSEQGFSYDSSIAEKPGYLSSNAASLIWPYTLDNGPAQSTPHTITPKPGLFEMPLWTLFDTNGIILTNAMDLPDQYDACLESLKYSFTRRYHGNRVPLGIYLHANTTNQWFARNPWAADVLNEFFTWAVTNHPDVWMLPMQTAAAYMRDPVNADEALIYPPFQIHTNAAPPSNAVNRCVYSNGIVNTCADCPNAYPQPGTVYTEFSAITGGVLQMNVESNGTNRLNVMLAVSNTLSFKADNWSASFLMPTQTVIKGLYGGLYTQTTNDGQRRLTVEPALWIRPILAGETQTNTWFIIEGATPEEIITSTFTLYQLTPMQPSFTALNANPDDTAAAHWDDSAYGYAIEQRTNLLTGAWTATTQIYGRTFCTNLASPHRLDAFRLRATP